MRKKEKPETQSCVSDFCVFYWGLSQFRCGNGVPGTEIVNDHLPPGPRRGPAAPVHVVKGKPLHAFFVGVPVGMGFGPIDQKRIGILSHRLVFILRELDRIGYGGIPQKVEGFNVHSLQLAGLVGGHIVAGNDGVHVRPAGGAGQDKGSQHGHLHVGEPGTEQRHHRRKYPQRQPEHEQAGHHPQLGQAEGTPHTGSSWRRT